jgi:hypothetical protein
MRASESAALTMAFMRVSRTVLIEHEDVPQFPYFKVGSAFLVRYNGAVFALTAHHCVKDYHADQIRIPAVDGGRDFLAFNKKWVPRGADANDHLDFLLLRVDPGATPGYANIGASQIDRSAVARARDLYRPGATLAFSGFPGEADNRIDYDGLSIRTQRVVSRVQYLDKGARPHTHLARDVDRLVTNYGSLSGSPVLSANASGADVAGLVVRADHSTGDMLFLDVAAIWSALQKTTV